MTSVPKLSLDAVPIQIVCCKKVISHGDRDHSDVKAFTSLWKNVLHAVESAKNCASSATKYQQNFCLLMQEVLRSNHHIFTDDEKNFMGINSNTKIFLLYFRIFPSLSDCDNILLFSFDRIIYFSFR